MEVTQLLEPQRPGRTTAVAAQQMEEEAAAVIDGERRPTVQTSRFGLVSHLFSPFTPARILASTYLRYWRRAIPQLEHRPEKMQQTLTQCISGGVASVNP
jgi:hypothetical protein